MKHRAVFARPGIVLFAVFVSSCSGGGGPTADMRPPSASQAQVQQIAMQQTEVQDARGAPLGDAPQDTGTLLPLDVLSVRTTSSVTPLAVTSCASTAACIGGTNSSTGPGVAGVSSKGKGVTGTTTFASTSTTNGQFGVYGQDSSTSGTFNAGVYGLSGNGIGVSGKSTNNFGVRGTSTNNVGVYGIGTRGVYGTGTTGAYGIGTSRGVYGTAATNTSAVGVFGNSPSYIAVEGTGAYGIYGAGTTYGVYGSAPVYASVGVASGSGIGGYFSAVSNDAGHFGTSSGNGVYATSGTGFGIQVHTGGHVGVYATNSNGNGADFQGSYAGVIARAPAGSGFPIVATDQNGANLFYVDGAGNIYYHGGAFHFAATSSGGQATALSPGSTRATIQDTGTAHLTNGRAVVPLDSTFASTIDTRAYQVFLTPGGDTRGLYVASKSSSVFVVREVQGGHGNFAFDYQITGVAVGKAAQRMTMVQPKAPLPHASQPAALPEIKQPKI